LSAARPLALALAFAALILAPRASAGDGAHGHPNHAALFLGATVHDGHVYTTVGLDYEYLFHEKAGVVALAELIIHDPLAQIAGAGLAFHPIAPVKIAALGGMEFADGHSAALVRGNLEYAFHAGAMGIAPSVSVDYMDSEVLYVLGVALGMGF
jgi:hypothetical protein